MKLTPTKITYVAKLPPKDLQAIIAKDKRMDFGECLFDRLNRISDVIDVEYDGSESFLEITTTPEANKIDLQFSILLEIQHYLKGLSECGGSAPICTNDTAPCAMTVPVVFAQT